MKIIWKKLEEFDVIEPYDYISNGDPRIMDPDDTHVISFGFADRDAWSFTVNQWRNRHVGLRPSYSVFRILGAEPTDFPKESESKDRRIELEL